MNDRTSDFSRVMDACMAQAYAHTIATERVIPLRPDLSRLERREMALQQLEAALDTLEMTREEPQDDYHRLRAAEIRMSNLTHAQRMKRSMLHLCGIFGRAP